MAFIAGIDGGNTKTVVMVCDLDGEVRGVGRGGSSNWEGMGFEKAAAAVTEVVEQALADAGGTRADLLWMHLGAAGLDWPEDETRMQEALTAVGWKCGMTLENDAFGAVRATAPGGCGIGVTAGTGVASGIIRPDGSTYFYGAYTDLGGGRDIDPRAVQAVVRAEDGRGPVTALTPALLQAAGHATVHDFVYAMHRGNGYPSHRITRPVLFSTAAQGDAVAVDILTYFAGQLALCATNLIRRDGLEGEAVPVVAAGTLFQRTGPLLFSLFSEALLGDAPKAAPILSDKPPLMGTVRGALRGCGHDTAACWARICDSAVSGGWLKKLGLDVKGDDDGES